VSDSELDRRDRAELKRALERFDAVVEGLIEAAAEGFGGAMAYVDPDPGDMPLWDRRISQWIELGQCLERTRQLVNELLADRLP
jgi:hypothetical protein